MKPRTMLLLVVAVALGLGAAWAAAKLLSAPKQQEEVAILVASQDIDQGTYLSDPSKYFKEKKFNKGQEPKNALTQVNDLKGRIVNKSMPEEQFVTENDLLPKDKQLIIPTTDGKPLTKDNRMEAVAVQVTPDAVAGGFVVPGSHVDVSYGEVLPKKDRYVQRTILFDVTVLAVDNLSELPEGQPAARNPNTITLALTPEQCERLALAKERGKLRFNLLSKAQYGKKEADRRRKDPAITDDLADQNDDRESMVDVWVAKEDIKAGTKVDDSLFTRKRYFETQKPQKAISDLARYKNLVFKHDLAANKFVTESDLDNPPPEPKPVVKLDGHILQIRNGPADMKVLYPKGGSYGVLLGDDGQPIGDLPPAKPAPAAGEGEAPAPAPQAAAKEWKTYSSKEGAFSVLMPGEVVAVNTSYADPKTGAQSDLHVFRASRPDVGEVAVAYVDLPTSALQEGAIQLLNERAEAMTKDLEGSMLLDGGPRPIQLGNYPGREVRLQLSDGKIDCRRIYLVKKRLYQVAVTGPKADPSAKDIANYFRSFTVESRN